MIDQNDRQLQKNDVNRVINIATGLDLTGYGATDFSIKVARPDSTTYLMTNTRTLVSGTKGLISVKTDTGELTQTGQYLLQVSMTHAGLPTQSTPIMDFWVDDVM